MIPATEGATVALAALLAISRQGLAGLEGAATAAVVRRRGNRVPRDGALGERQGAWGGWSSQTSAPVAGESDSPSPRPRDRLGC